MTVYLLLDAADIHTTYAVFSTREKAEDFIVAHVKEYPYDKSRFYIDSIEVDEYAAKDICTRK